MKKSGKRVFAIASLFVVGYALGSFSYRSRSFIKSKSGVSWQQYVNRISEFCLDSQQESKKEFIDLIESGINYEEAFNIVIMSSEKENILGNIND